jgi:hypothetical protein
MPDTATPRQRAAARLRPSRNGSAPPLPAEITHARREWSDRLRMAIAQVRGMMRRITRRP